MFQLIVNTFNQLLTPSSMGKKRANNDTNSVENLVEESTPTKKIKKTENLASNDEIVKEAAPVEQQKKQRGRPKKITKSKGNKIKVDNQELEEQVTKNNQEIDEPVVEDIQENKKAVRRGRSKRIVSEIESNKQTEANLKEKANQEIEQEEEEEELDKEDNRIPIFDSEEGELEKEDTNQLESNNDLNTSLEKFDFQIFAGIEQNKETNTESSDEKNEESKETSEVIPKDVEEVETKPKRGRSKKVSTVTTVSNVTELEPQQTSSTKSTTRATRKNSTKNKDSDKNADSKSPPKTTKAARKVSTTKKDKEEEKEEEEETSFVESADDKKPKKQARKPKNSHFEQEDKSLDVVDKPKGKSKATKGKKLIKLTQKVIEEEKEEDLSGKEEESEEETENQKEKINIDSKKSSISNKKMSKKSDNKHPFKIISSNCAGVRAAVKKGLVEFINDQDADIVCLQEVKCPEDKIPKELQELDYHIYWSSSKSKSGHSGVATLSKIEPINVTYGIGSEIHDNEGRIITCEYENFYLINVYVTNASRNLVNLDKKRDWNETFKNYLITLDRNKPVIACGDFNCAHKEIDLKNPKANQKNAGFTPEERSDFTDLLDSGFIDSFRHFYPDRKDAYTFWSHLGSARANNVGWRLDYHIISDRLKDALIDSIINDDQYFSDHCPITLLINI